MHKLSRRDVLCGTGVAALAAAVVPFGLAKADGPISADQRRRCLRLPISSWAIIDRPSLPANGSSESASRGPCRRSSPTK